MEATWLDCKALVGCPEGDGFENCKLEKCQEAHQHNLYCLDTQPETYVDCFAPFKAAYWFCPLNSRKRSDWLWESV